MLKSINSSSTFYFHINLVTMRSISLSVLMAELSQKDIRIYLQLQKRFLVYIEKRYPIPGVCREQSYYSQKMKELRISTQFKSLERVVGLL